MKQLRFLILLGAIAVLSACGLQASPSLGDRIVVTDGVVTTVPTTGSLRTQSDLDGVAVLEGSVGELQVCSDGGTAPVDVVYTAKGSQAGTSTFSVYSTHLFDATATDPSLAWIGSDEVEVDVPPQSEWTERDAADQPIFTVIVPMTFGASGDVPEGTVTRSFLPHAVSHSNTKGAKLGIEDATVEVTIEFISCASVEVMPLLAPVKDDGSSRFKKGSVVPIKFHSGDWGSELAEELRLTLYKVGEPDAGTSVDTIEAAGSTVWRYDLDDDQYIFNLRTSNIPAGLWEAIVTIGSEESEVTVAMGWFSIR